MNETSSLPVTAHVIVLGNEKGGSGKSTTAMHVIVALLKWGKSVGSIDIDSRQQSLTRYVENRRNWADRHELLIPHPIHRTVALDAEGHLRKDDDSEFAAFADAVVTLEHTCDFLVIDSPGSDNYLSRLGHSMADTLVTPVNDSFVDLDVLGSVCPETLQFRQASQYSEMVRQSRKRRFTVDGGEIDWVVVRNRLSPLGSRNTKRIEKFVVELSHHLDFRIASGVSERVVFRELFPQGLTLFDVIEDDSAKDVTLSHLAAQVEIRALLDTLRLPRSHSVSPPLAGGNGSSEAIG